MGIDRRLTPEGRLAKLEADLEWVREVLLAWLAELDERSGESYIRVA